MLTTMLRPEEIAPRTIRPLLRREYDRLVEAGVFGPEDPIELLRGSLVTMSPQKPPHAGATEELVELLALAIGRRAKVRCQLPFAATDDSEPEPDVAVVPRRSYRTSHPTKAYLVVEVAWDSTRTDLGVKPGVYAEAGVPEYWVVNLPDAVIDVFTEPFPDGYAKHRRAQRGEQLALASFPDVNIAVDDVLPRRRPPRPRARKPRRR
jgi:Uma2 family endonuclease